MLIYMFSFQVKSQQTGPSLPSETPALKQLWEMCLPPSGVSVRLLMATTCQGCGCNDTPPSKLSQLYGDTSTSIFDSHTPSQNFLPVQVPGYQRPPPELQIHPGHSKTDIEQILSQAATPLHTSCASSENHQLSALP